MKLSQAGDREGKTGGGTAIGETARSHPATAENLGPGFRRPRIILFISLKIPNMFGIGTLDYVPEAALNIR